MTLYDRFMSRYEEEENFQKSFDTVARYLMFETSLKVNQQEFIIKELEFYLHSKKLDHMDPFVHCNEKQLSSNRFYFHESGLDITFGNKGENIYAGALIRSVKKIDHYTVGPLNSMKEILFGDCDSQQSSDKLMDLKVSLDEHKYNGSEVLIESVRVGLSPSDGQCVDSSKDPECYIYKKYRYVAHDAVYEILKNEKKYSHYLAFDSLKYLCRFNRNKKRSILEKVDYIFDKKFLEINNDKQKNIRENLRREFENNCQDLYETISPCCKKDEPLCHNLLDKMENQCKK